MRHNSTHSSPSAVMLLYADTTTSLRAGGCYNQCIMYVYSRAVPARVLEVPTSASVPST